VEHADRDRDVRVLGRLREVVDQALRILDVVVDDPGDLKNVVAKLAADPAYPPLFRAAFGTENITPDNIALALENFLITRVSLDSKFDRAFAGKEALTTQEKRGFELFFTESEPRMKMLGADCFNCHGGANFTDHSFHNNGLAATDDFGVEMITVLATNRH
jgi:cytochrome c peroxidase